MVNVLAPATIQVDCYAPISEAVKKRVIADWALKGIMYSALPDAIIAYVIVSVENEPYRTS